MLIKEINETIVEENSLALWWLGQSGFVIKGDGLVIYLDPYLSTRLERMTANAVPEKRHVRLWAIPVAPEEISNADYVICSHDHGDHLDPETLAPLYQASPNVRFVIPNTARERLIQLGIPAKRIISVNVGHSVDLGRIKLTPIPGKHNEFDQNEDGSYPYLGYLIEINGITIYHAGDTIIYNGLVERLSRYLIDIALLPINGGDPVRVAHGFMSNMNYQEAADLGAAIHARLIIPTHYGMFQINTEDVGNFEKYIVKAHPRQGYQIMSQGKRFMFLKV